MMKSKKIIQLVLFIGLSTTLFAQAKFKEGIAEFAITYPEMTEQMKQMESMLPTTATLYFKDGKCRTETTMLMGTTVILSDNSKKGIIMLMEMMGQKIAITPSEKELKEMGSNTKYQATLSKETKIIAGYLCKKATITSSINGQSQQQIECYYTEALPKLSSNGMEGFNSINGFVMEYATNQNGMKVNMKVTKIKPATVEDSKFSIPSDYKKVTTEEAAKLMMGAMDDK